MPITPKPTDRSLPPLEDLTVEEINISSPVLRAASHFLGKYCDDQCKEYMLCKAEEKDPRRCLLEGKEVTSCGMQFFRQLKRTCRAEVEAFAKCLEWNSSTLQFHYCRQAQMLFDQCMKEKMNIERPPLYYFNQVRVHKTERPKPKDWRPKFEDAPKGLPDDFPRKPPIN